MKLSEETIGDNGVKYLIEYCDADNFTDLIEDKWHQIYAVCFIGDEMLIANEPEGRGWGLIGGRKDEGETFEQTLRREVQEESNMEILSYLPVGYRKIINTETGNYLIQLRYAAKVQPYGDFVSDPAGVVTEIKLIDPTTYKLYFDWGPSGDRIIERAIQLKDKL